MKKNVWTFINAIYPKPYQVISGSLFVLLLCLLPQYQTQAQSAFSVSGYIKDAETGEDLIGATIFAPAVGKGTSTNAYGYFSLSLPADTVTLVASFIGYQSGVKKVNVNANQQLIIQLTPAKQELEEVVVTAEGSPQERINTTQMSLDRITAKEIKQIPAVFGEVDVIKVLQLKPGVKSGGEGTTGFYVRGGGPDQNLIVLDEAVVYNASHLFGFFSTFNPDAVKDVELYKGDFPSRFGGRLSSVVDIKLKEGNKQKFSGSGGIGLIASRLTVEAPIVKDKASFMLSGRRTYLDLFTRAINRANQNDPNYSAIPDYYFYDLNTKVNYELGAKDRVFLSGYFGRDVLNFKNEDLDFGFNWGNITTTTRWNHIFSPKLFANTSLIFSDYQYNINTKFDIFSLKIGSRITDYNGKIDFDFLHTHNHTIKFGAQYTYHDVQVGRLRTAEVGINPSDRGQRLFASEVGLYVSSDWEPTSRWRFNSGFRFSGFETRKKWYGGVEPRFSARYKITENTAVKVSAARMYQYIHLVSNSGASLPTDIWYPSNRVVTPQRSDQVAAGVSTLLGNGKFLLSNEVYYKWMKNQIDFRDGAQLFLNNNLDQEFVFGKGWSYGNEIYLEKKTGKTTGWVGYTLSWTWRKFAAIDNGNPFFPRYDRRHDVTAVVIQELSKRISLSATWVYGTGNAVSLPIGRFQLQDITGEDPIAVPEYQARNDFRMAPYHRLDLGLIIKFNPKWGESDLTISIYNAYNRRNPFFIYFDEVADANTQEVTAYQAKQVSLFPIIPALTYNFRF